MTSMISSFFFLQNQRTRHKTVFSGWVVLLAMSKLICMCKRGGVPLLISAQCCLTDCQTQMLIYWSSAVLDYIPLCSGLWLFGGSWTRSLNVICGRSFDSFQAASPVMIRPHVCLALWTWSEVNQNDPVPTALKTHRPTLTAGLL